MEILPLMWKCNPFKFFLVFFFLAMVHGFCDLNSLTRIELGPSAMRVQSPNHWTTREFPCCCRCYGTSIMSNSVRPLRWQPTWLPRPWDSPGKNTGVGCHFLLQCMKVKSESEVAQLCPTLSDPMDCSLPGSSVHRIFQARVLEWGATAFSEGIPLFVL